MKLEFKRRELEINLYGKLVKMSFPNVSQFKKYQDELGKSENEVEIMLNFLTELGLDRKDIDDMEPEHLRQIIEVISGSKKK